jgi:hypothetical protein
MHRLHQRAVALLAGLVASPGLVRADHDMAMSEHHHGASEVSVGVLLQAAEFETRYYTGSYQGIAPSLGWMGGRFGLNATIGLYHLVENGRTSYGFGDAMATAHVTAVASDAVDAGVAFHLMWPTGSEIAGLGMGHAMAVPSVWATWRLDRVTLRATGGYGRALIAIDDSHDHGLMPLVDPMNMQEVTWSAGAEVALDHGVRVGGRTAGGIPIGTGAFRMIGAGRVAWGTPRISTGLELQLGVAGDPFTVRGIVDTALRF